MNKSRLYTRTGDGGMTTTVSGKRIPKTAACIEAYGTIDELNSSLGYLVSLLPADSEDKPFLEHIQAVLFDIGLGFTEAKPETGSISQEDIDFIERQIDKEDGKLPELHNFLVPGGPPSAAYAHVCRTICRRAERCMFALSYGQPVSLLSLSYINRLSDYLFVLSRKLNFIDNKLDNITEKSDCKTCG